MKAKVHTLSSDKISQIIGIASHLSDYKLSWLFNEQLNFKFQQSDDINIDNPKSANPDKYSTYKFEDESDLLYTLISNRAEMSILIKSLKNIDYFLKIEGKISSAQLSILIEKIKKLQNIMTAFEIDQTTIKPKELDLFF